MKILILTLLLLSALAYFHLTEAQPVIKPIYIYPPAADSSIYIGPPAPTEPSPFGVADYGIGPNFTRYILNTTQFLGIVHIDYLNASSFYDNSVSFQLNVVLSYKANNHNYALWIQNVAFYDTNNKTVCFLDNIWNFSSTNAKVQGVIGQGVISEYGTTTYYWHPALEAPYSPAKLSLPVTFYLLVNVTTNSLGQPVIYFWFNDGYGWINYDTVTVTNVKNAADVYFLVDGSNITPAGYYYDAELVMGGPGLGSCAYIRNSSVYLELMYWNGHNFQEIKNAYPVGADTAEKVNNVIPLLYHSPITGELAIKIIAGLRSLPVGPLWAQNNISEVIIKTPINAGYAVVYNSSYGLNHLNISSLKIPFFNGELILTLFPMNYNVLIFNFNNSLVSGTIINALAGENVYVELSNFSISAPSIITTYQYSNLEVNLTIEAYGYVKLSIVTPQNITYYLSNNSIYVNRNATVPVEFHINSMPGNYTIIINVSLYNEFYKLVKIHLYVLPSYKIIFDYIVIGQPFPQSPLLTIIFPNGTAENFSFIRGLMLYLPNGTMYTIQKLIQENNAIRWITYNTTSGIIESSKNITIVYITQYLVTINNISKWYDIGSKIYLNASIPFYEIGRFIGTFNVSTNTVITVDRPIIESLAIYPNPLLLYVIPAIVITVILSLLFLKRK